MSLIFYFLYLYFFFEHSIVVLVGFLQSYIFYVIFYSMMTYYYAWYRYETLLAVQDQLLKTHYKKLQNIQRFFTLVLVCVFLIALFVK